MNSMKFTFVILLTITGMMTMAQSGKPAVKLKRADSFFGVHFDLHASKDITDAGRTLTAAMIDTFLAKVRPDFIQIDCKGHPGISSYPTKVGFPVKGFEKDPLKLFREVTEKNNVALYLHFSGVWDNRVVQEHPDWAVLNAKGEKSKQKVSFFSPYLDTYLIPQLKELSDYRADGAWIDGDNWAVERDYGKASIERFTKETGITEIPKSPSDKHFPEFNSYTRSLFREYLKKYIDAIHQYNPAFQITSNWSYSSMMPEKVTIGVDFLSGDLTPQNGVYQSAFEARCIAPQGKPWDLMAWGFSWNFLNEGIMPRTNKSAVQLEQEAAQSMAMGGGVQVYYQQNRDLSLKPWLETTLAEVAKFCRDRQQFCHKATPVPQIALLYPTAAVYKNSFRPFANPTAMLQGAMNLVLDGQHPVEILMEHHLKSKMSQYPLIIIPECNFLEPDFIVELKSYVKDGGNLLIIGAATTKLFEKELGIKSSEEVAVNNTFIATSGKIGAIRSVLNSVELLPGTIPVANFYDTDDFRSKGKIIAASVGNFGKGKIAGIYFNAASGYTEYKSPVLRDFISDRITELFPAGMVRVSGSHLVHVAVNRLKDKMYVNLINVAGEHTNQAALGYDEVPPLQNLRVSINTGKKPAAIKLQPEGKVMKFDYMNGISKVTVPNLPIHSILEIIP